MEKMMQELINQIFLFAPRAVVSALVFFSFWLASIILQKVIRHLGEKKDLSKDILILIGKTAKITLIVFGAVTALGTLGINVSALVAGLGLVGFALGFALKDIISNFLAGTLILIYRPFRHNDHISVAGFEGIVTEIDLRYITLQAEGKKILIPNSKLFTNAITVLDAKK